MESMTSPTTTTVDDELRQYFDAEKSFEGMYPTPMSNPAYVSVINCENTIFFNIKQFIKNELTGTYCCNSEGVTLSTEDLSSLMLTLRGIEDKLSGDIKIVNNRAESLILGDKPRKSMKKSKNT